AVRLCQQTHLLRNDLRQSPGWFVRCHGCGVLGVAGVAASLSGWLEIYRSPWRSDRACGASGRELPVQFLVMRPLRQTCRDKPRFGTAPALRAYPGKRTGLLVVF